MPAAAPIRQRQDSGLRTQCLYGELHAVTCVEKRTCKKLAVAAVVLALRDGMCPYWKGARVEGPTGTSSALPAAPTQSATERRCMPTVFVDMPTAMCAPLLHACRRNMPQPSRHDDEDERGTTGGGTRGERSGRGHGAGRRREHATAGAAEERRGKGRGKQAAEGGVALSKKDLYRIYVYMLR